MEESRITKGNILIADFMDYQWPSTDRYTDIEAKEIKQYEVNNLKYHSSFDWQVPVWHKFLRVVSERRSKDHLQETDFAKQIDIWENNYHSAIDVNSPADGFSILVLAIEWYNQNQSTLF